MKNYFLAFFTLLSTALFSQEKATLSGTVADALSNQPIELVTVYVKNTANATETAVDGKWKLEVPAGQRIVLVFSRIGYKESQVDVEPLPQGSRQQIDVALPPSDAEIEVIVQESRLDQGGLIREEVGELKLLPTTTGNLESVLPHIALGTSSGSGGELTSQYNVRGGNYDENLVYVNDFEIYRPQLIRAGQQEGLTFPNIDLIQSLTFSSGGFEARFGDKMSSVLDIRYKRPEQFRGSAAASFLGGSAHLEGSFQPGVDKYKKLRYLVGARYKTTRYLLGTLDVEGEYTPNFGDVQAYLTYDLNRVWQLGLMGNYNRSQFYFKPESRVTGFGLINFALQLFSVFEGQEVDDFTTGMGGLSLTYLPDREKNPFFVKFLASAHRSDENEKFDIIGRYSLRQVESNLGSSDFGEVVAELGTGTQHQYVRNYLDAIVTNAEVKGGADFQKTIGGSDASHTSYLIPHTSKSHFLQWSLKFQHEDIEDKINEWERLDSAGYSLKY
ncbi:MAG: TonB-dependent receptor, partial [Bacteroidota bacterium]